MCNAHVVFGVCLVGLDVWLELRTRIFITNKAILLQLCHTLQDWNLDHWLLGPSAYLIHYYSLDNKMTNDKFKFRLIKSWILAVAKLTWGLER